MLRLCFASVFVRASSLHVFALFAALGISFSVFASSSSRDGPPRRNEIDLSTATGFHGMRSGSPSVVD